MRALELRRAAGLDRVKAAGFTVVAVLVAYQGAQRMVTGGRMVLYLLVAVAVGALILERPRDATLVMLVFSAPLFHQFIQLVSVGGVQTDAFEVLAYGLVAGWLIARGREERLPSWRFAGPVLLLLAGATVGAVYALLHGGSRYVIQGQYKSYLVYLLVLPLTALFATHAEKLRLERMVVGFCAVGSAVVLAAVALGSDLPSEAPDLPLNTFGVTTQVQRLRPAMLWLLFVATLIVLNRVFTNGMKPRSAAELTLFFLVWVFSFNRSSWAALVICAALLALLRPGVRKTGRMLRTVAGLALALPLLLAVAASGALGTTAKAVPVRLESIVNPRVLHEDAIQDRASEYPVAIRALERSPIVGVGLGRPFGARRPVYDPRLGVVTYIDRPYSHNSLLFAYLQTGLLGVAALAWLGVATWRSGSRARKRYPPEAAGRMVVGSLALLGFGIQSLSQTSLLHRPGITAAVVAMVLATPVKELQDRG